MFPLFIIGLRRSGTSILRKLVLEHPKVKWLDFEPHELFFVLESMPINRYKNQEYHQRVLKRYSGHPEGITGCKVAVNVGIEALRYKRIEQFIPNAHYIFIKRNPLNTYQSWIKNETSVRGICGYELYLPWYAHIYCDINNFCTIGDKSKFERTVMIEYESLLKDADKELSKVWKMLKVEPIKELNKFIREPENK